MLPVWYGKHVGAVWPLISRIESLANLAVNPNPLTILQIQGKIFKQKKIAKKKSKRHLEDKYEPVSPIKCSQNCIVTLTTSQIESDFNLQKTENKSYNVQNNAQNDVQKCTIRKMEVRDIPCISRKYPEIIKHLNIWYTDLINRVLQTEIKVSSENFLKFFWYFFMNFEIFFVLFSELFYPDQKQKREIGSSRFWKS